MAVLNLFSHRKRVSERKLPDVYSYDHLPDSLKIQIAHIWRDAIGPFHLYNIYDRYLSTSNIENNQAWEQIHNAVSREHGVLDLGRDPQIDERCRNYLLELTNVELALDIIEFSFVYIDTIARNLDQTERKRHGISVTADEAISELNQRFLRAGVGYQYAAGKIFRMDSELVHNEIILPALRYLDQEGFEGPCEEFLKAHMHYRKGDLKNAIIDANNSFESTLKTICQQRDWIYPNSANASDLIRIVRKNGLLPTYLQRSFEQLSATLKSGLPKVRNEEGAHGQGVAPRKTPSYVAAYALHLAASKILFLVDAHKSST